MTPLEKLIRQTLDGFRPPRRLSLSDWADAFAYLSAESSAEAGRWHTIPYQKGIMDAITDPSVTRVTVMKSARVGYTKMLNHVIGYHVHQDPCPIMLVQPTVEDAEGYSKDEIAPMLRDTPVLRGMVADAKSRTTTNTIRKKTFPGGQLLMIGANSPGGFRRVSIRVLLFDEVDGYPASAGAEGDQIKLGERRTEYYHNRKIVMGSTPTNLEISRIHPSYEASDMRRYYVPCPHCQHMQHLRWDNLRWEAGKPETAKYACEACGELIDHTFKRWMVERGEWRAEKPFKGHAGFHIWAVYSYSPNATWAHLAEEYENLKDDGERKTFHNTVLGLPWEEDAVSLDESALRARAEEYPADLPIGVLVLTCGVDVQADRLEYEVVGWGHGNESWGVEYGVLLGNPSQPDVWRQLDQVLAREWSFADGTTMTVKRACVDSGYLSSEVYKYCAPREMRGVFAIKGTFGQDRPVVGKMTRIKKYKCHLTPVGVDTCKEMLFQRLSVAEGTGLCHFPVDPNNRRGYGQAYYDGLLSEQRVLRYKQGRPFFQWVKKRTHIRNEPLDCRNYATAALEILRPNYAAYEKQLSETRAVGGAQRTAAPLVRRAQPKTAATRRGLDY